MEKESASRPTSTVTRTYYLDDLTFGSLQRILAEARDAGVPLSAETSLTVFKEGSLATVMMAAAGEEPRSRITFTWQG